jgi:hypothetical protein
MDRPIIMVAKSDESVLLRNDSTYALIQRNDWGYKALFESYNIGDTLK